MENTNNINNIITEEIVSPEIKTKRVRANKQYTEEEIQAKVEKQRAFAMAYYNKHKDTEEYKEKNREHAKTQYNKDKEKVIARVRLNQKRIKDTIQLERLNELKEQGLITFNLDSMSKEELLSNLEILGVY
jgi:hypothetical protein